MKKLIQYFILLIFFITVATISILNQVKAEKFVPIPSSILTMEVEEGNIYSFPWIENISCSKLNLGCFKVVSIDKNSVVIEHPAFEDADKLKGFGWNLFTTIDKNGVEYKLYKFGKGSNEEWVYAVANIDKNTLTFLKLPGSSSGKAVIYRFVDVDFAKKKIMDTYIVESNEMITMFASANIEKLIPQASIASIKVNGESVEFLYNKIMNLNLPAGKNTIAVELNLEQLEVLELSPIYEPRNMSLPKEINLNIKGKEKILVEIRTIGIPNKVWEESDVILASTQADNIIKQPLTKILEFKKDNINIKTKATIQYKGRSYPVIIKIE
ncbi:MAG: hypothetical protein IH934_00055 [Nanoarchaeota archaeon]|nr:hypothetical protein [Nanoarchaeota archaeon]